MTTSIEKQFGIYFYNALGAKQKEICILLNILKPTLRRYLKNDEMVKLAKDYVKYGYKAHVESIFSPGIKYYNKKKSLETLALISAKIGISIGKLEKLVENYQNDRIHFIQK